VCTAFVVWASAPSPLSASTFYRMLFPPARHRRIHALLNPPVQDLATEIQGLLHRLPRLANGRQQYQDRMLTLSALPTHYMTAFHNHALVTKVWFFSSRLYPRVSRVVLDSHSRDRVFGSRIDASPHIKKYSPAATRRMRITCYRNKCNKLSYQITVTALSPWLAL
jgi:hypothetical protein